MLTKKQILQEVEDAPNATECQKLKETYFRQLYGREAYITHYRAEQKLSAEITELKHKLELSRGSNVFLMKEIKKYEDSQRNDIP